LRLVLEARGRQIVTLRQELQIVSSYLEIERVRLGDRLQQQLHCAPETLEAMVPVLILQPLVENAVQHGICRRPGAGLIRVSASIDESTLRITVEDDGPGIPEGSSGSEGVGVGNTRLRLEQMFGSLQSFQLSNRPGGGAIATLTIPLAFETDRESHDDGSVTDIRRKAALRS
jgi:sensor histidine kinase YesM